MPTSDPSPQVGRGESPAPNERDQLTEFTVMVRPIRALERLVVHMREQLGRLAP